MLEVRSLGMFLAVSVGAAVARGGVIVVDASGGGQFTTIQAAVTAASEGDTILVKSGTYYGGFVVDGKALTIVVDTSAIVTVDGSIAVVNLWPTQNVVLAGLSSQGQNTYWFPSEIDQAGFYAVNNAGPIRVQSCTFQGGWGYVDQWCGCFGGQVCHGAKGVILRNNSAGIAFDRCDVTGGSSLGEYQYGCGQPSNNGGGEGLELRNGRVALYDCTVYGGTGGDSWALAGDGGDGARLTSTGVFTSLIASGTTIRGGRGGSRIPGGISPGGDGGDGMLLDSGTIAWFVGDTPLGRSGGDPGGTPGQPLSGSGQAFDFGVPRLRLEIPTPVREATTTTIIVRGRSGDEVYMFTSRETGFLATATWKGARISTRPVPSFPGGLPAADPVRILGTIPASGVLTVDLQIPTLDPAVLEENWFFQVWRNSPVDGRTLGGFAVVTILDSSY